MFWWSDFMTLLIKVQENSCQWWIIFKRTNNSKSESKMVIRYNDILTIITTLGENNGLSVSVYESIKGGAIAGQSKIYRKICQNFDAILWRKLCYSRRNDSRTSWTCNRWSHWRLFSLHFRWRQVPSSQPCDHVRNEGRGETAACGFGSEHHPQPRCRRRSRGKLFTVIC